MKNMLFFLGGVVAGVTAGILLAPKSGKETRADITDKIDKLQSKISDFAKDKIAKAKE